MPGDLIDARAGAEAALVALDEATDEPGDVEAADEARRQLVEALIRREDARSGV